MYQLRAEVALRHLVALGHELVGEIVVVEIVIAHVVEPYPQVCGAVPVVCSHAYVSLVFEHVLRAGEYGVLYRVGNVFGRADVEDVAHGECRLVQQIPARGIESVDVAAHVAGYGLARPSLRRGYIVNRRARLLAASVLVPYHQSAASVGRIVLQVFSPLRVVKVLRCEVGVVVVPAEISGRFEHVSVGEGQLKGYFLPRLYINAVSP